MKIPGLGSPAETLTRRMFTRIIVSVARATRENELSVAQLSALYLLDERGTLRVGDVSGELDLSLPTTSRLIDDLVRQKLVAREEDPRDRRARVLSLTSKGRAFIEKSSEARISTIAGTLRELPASMLKSVMTTMLGQK